MRNEVADVEVAEVADAEVAEVAGDVAEVAERLLMLMRNEMAEE